MVSGYIGSRHIDTSSASPLSAFPGATRVEGVDGNKIHKHTYEDEHVQNKIIEVLARV